jgi:hypothetical protein
MAAVLYLKEPGNARTRRTAMSTGREYLARIHEKLRAFEEAVIEREKFKPLDSKVTRQQDVDTARDKLMETIVDIVTRARLQDQ